MLDAVIPALGDRQGRARVRRRFRWPPPLRSPARSPPSRRACRSYATPRSRRWCATMRGRSSRRPAWPMPASTSSWSTIRSFNAFVAGRRMFINTGALMRPKRPTRSSASSRTRPATSPAATSRSCATSSSAPRRWRSSPRCLAPAPSSPARPPTAGGLAGAGMGVAAGGGEMARRSLLAYQRTEEITADRSAITYLNATGQSGKGMLKTFAALPERAVAVGRAGRSLPDQPSDAAGPHRQSRSAGRSRAPISTRSTRRRCSSAMT